MENEVSPRFLPAGESALVVEFGNVIDPVLNDWVRALDRALAAHPIAGIIETVPTYRSLMIHFEPRVLSIEVLSTYIRALELMPEQAAAAHHWRIPACYDEPYAEDIAEVAAALDLPKEEVIALHASAPYRVYMYGFAPGYVFLGGLPQELHISRRQKPRPPVPPGSLLIAGGQALIASVSMPTGWYSLGATPAMLFDPKREPPSVIEIGDHVTFERIDRTTYANLRQAALNGASVARRM